jgi:hypothetical protein
MSGALCQRHGSHFTEEQLQTDGRFTSLVGVARSYMSGTYIGGKSDQKQHVFSLAA